MPQWTTFLIYGIIIAILIAILGKFAWDFFKNKTPLYKPKDMKSNQSEVKYDTNSIIKFSINKEKIANNGEDADPLLAKEELGNRILLATFDGMGGAGSKLYEYQGEQKTGAYIGARLTRTATWEYFSSSDSEEGFNTIALKEHILKTLKEVESKLKTSKSFLKSTLIKSFPTTISGLFLNKEETKVDVNSFWAGDSRNYCLNPSKGLQQLTKDDLKGKDIDPFENLKKDAPLSNCVSADIDFTIHNKSFSFSLPIIFISATDGCFNYLSSPMHFEELIIDNILKANSKDELKAGIIEQLSKIAGDDFSMAFVALGWNTYSDLKADFNERNKQLLEVLHEFEQMDYKINQKNNELELLKLENEEHKDAIWKKYKSSYYSNLINENK